MTKALLIVEREDGSRLFAYTVNHDGSPEGFGGFVNNVFDGEVPALEAVCYVIKYGDGRTIDPDFIDEADGEWVYIVKLEGPRDEIKGIDVERR